MSFVVRTIMLHSVVSPRRVGRREETEGGEVMRKDVGNPSLSLINITKALRVHVAQAVDQWFPIVWRSGGALGVWTPTGLSCCMGGGGGTPRGFHSPPPPPPFPAASFYASRVFATRLYMWYVWWLKFLPRWSIKIPWLSKDKSSCGHDRQMWRRTVASSGCPTMVHTTTKFTPQRGTRPLTFFHFSEVCAFAGPLPPPLPLALDVLGTTAACSCRLHPIRMFQEAHQEPFSSGPG